MAGLSTTITSLADFLFEHRNYLNDIGFTIHSVELFDETSHPPNVVGGQLVALYENKIQSSWFEPQCMDEYKFGIVLRFPSLTEKPSSYFITAESDILPKTIGASNKFVGQVFK